MNHLRIPGQGKLSVTFVAAMVLLSCIGGNALADETQHQPGLEIRTEAAFRFLHENSLIPDREEVRVTEQPNEQTTLELVTTPDEADIFLDGRYLGRSPLVVQSPGLGTRTLQVSREGYRELRYEVTLREASETRVEVRLLRRSGYLVIERVTPQQGGPPAEFLLDGERLRGGIHELPVGSYQLRVRRFGFRELRSQINIQPDTATIIQAHLQAQPFDLTSLRSSTRVVNPDDVGRLGQVQLRVGATAPGTFLIRILNTAGETVHSIGPAPANDFVTELMWDGADDKGEAVPDGRYLVTAYRLAGDKTSADRSQLPNASAAPELTTGVEVNREFRLRMRSPFSVQAGTALVPGLEVLPPGRIQFAGAAGYHAGAFQNGSPEYYPGVIQLRVGLPAHLELGALVGGQLYDDPEFHRYDASVGLVHSNLRATVGPFRSRAGIGLRGTLSDSNQGEPTDRPDPFGASSGVALSLPIELSHRCVYLRAAPELGSAYPRPSYVPDDADALLLFFAARVALAVDVGYLNAALSWTWRSDLEEDPFARTVPDTVLAEFQLLIPGTVVFIHAAAGLDYVPGKNHAALASAGLGVLY